MILAVGISADSSNSGNQPYNDYGLRYVHPPLDFPPFVGRFVQMYCRVLGSCPIDLVATPTPGQRPSRAGK